MILYNVLDDDRRRNIGRENVHKAASKHVSIAKRMDILNEKGLRAVTMCSFYFV